MWVPGPPSKIFTTPATPKVSPKNFWVPNLEWKSNYEKNLTAPSPPPKKKGPFFYVCVGGEKSNKVVFRQNWPKISTILLFWGFQMSPEKFSFGLNIGHFWVKNSSFFPRSFLNRIKSQKNLGSYNHFRPFFSSILNKTAGSIFWWFSASFWS